MIIDEVGPRISDDDVSEFERKTGLVVRGAYRNFLLSFNGGLPSPDTVDIVGLVDSPTDVQVFFGIGRGERTSNIDWNLTLLKERGTGGNVLPIACDSGGNMFCLRPNSSGEDVVYINLSSEAPQELLVASGFEEFVGSLREF